MTEKIVALTAALGQLEADEQLKTLCSVSEKALREQLRPGLSPEDCGESFPLAAAWLSLADLTVSREDGVSAFTAGDVSIRQESGGQRYRELREMAFRLMRPFLADPGFAFLGVSG